MKMLSMFVLAFGLALTMGCSQETKDKAGEAATATGDAVKSAAEDTVENSKEVVDKVDDAVNGDDTPTEPADETN